jgi:PEP-CTERM motif
VSRSIFASALAMILPGLVATQARADLSVTLESVILASGGTGTMDISVTSNGGDTLSSFGLELQIAPTPGTTSVLQFTTTQTDPYGNSNYVFSGESSNSDLGIPFWSNPTLTPPYNALTITGGDMDDLTQGYVSIGASPDGPNTYLATVQFQAAPGATVGDGFLVSLVNDPNFTYFDDQYGNPYLSTNVSVSGGMVTIAAAVPEPSSLMMTLAGLGGLLWYWRGRRPGRARISSRRLFPAS